MAHGNETLLLSLGIIVGLPVVFGLAGWLFVKFWRDPTFGRPHACPHCQRQGRVASFGTFECVSCQQVFYLSESGRNVASLGQALAGPLVWGTISGLLIVGIDLHLARPWWDSGLYWFHILMQMSQGIARKKFPAE